MKTNPYPGKFVAFEGIDGCGKTTQATLLAETLEKAGYQILLTKEPTAEGVFGKLVRAIYSCQSLANELPRIIDSCLDARDKDLIEVMKSDAKKRGINHIDRFEGIIRDIKKGNHERLPLLIQLGMMFDRYDHRLRVEIPALGKGVHVMSDRDFPSTLAYGAADDISWQELREMQEELFEGDLIIPDLFIFLDLPVEIAFQRTLNKQGGKKEYFDSRERLSKIQKTYCEIFEEMPELKSTVKTIDGSADIQTIQKEILGIVKPFIEKSIA